MLATDVQEHEQILAAIEDGKASAAERLSRAHIAASLDRLLDTTDDS
jgi:DNA-binding GntR family transcriptional regulator